ncbi:hypothetical protein KI387_018185, partial [Taxus chinensis]
MKWNFNCFNVGTGSKKTKETFTNRRRNNDGKSKYLKPEAYSAYAGESRPKAEGFVRIVSFSQRGEVSPVTVVWKSHKENGFEDKARKLEMRETIRVKTNTQAVQKARHVPRDSIDEPFVRPNISIPIGGLKTNKTQYVSATSESITSKTSAKLEGFDAVI